MNKLRNKIENSKINFASKFFKGILISTLIVVIALVFGLCFGPNKTLDYKGGIIVSVVADTQTNLNEKDEYKAFKKELDEVLNENNINGKVYTVEINEQEEYTLVVKAENNFKKSELSEKLLEVKNEIVLKFGLNAEDVENNNLVIVDTFGSSVPSKLWLSIALSTLIAIVIGAIYIFTRAGLFAGVTSVIYSLFNIVIYSAITIATRVPMSYASIYIFPAIAILSLITSFLFAKKVSVLLKESEKYEKESNDVLVNDAIKSNLYPQVVYSLGLCIFALVIGLANITNSVLFLALELFIAVATVFLTNLFILPGFYAKNYVRKVKKNRQKEQND